MSTWHSVQREELLFEQKLRDRFQFFDGAVRALGDVDEIVLPVRVIQEVEREIARIMPFVTRADRRIGIALAEHRLAERRLVPKYPAILERTDDSDVGIDRLFERIERDEILIVERRVVFRIFSVN